VDPPTETAVGAGDDIFAANYLGIPHDPVGDELRMLEHVGRVTDHARNHNLVRRHLQVAPDLLFVLVADVACFNGITLSIDHQQQIYDSLQLESVLCGPCRLPQQM